MNRYEVLDVVMFPADLPEDQALLKTVLAPLLDDFSYWFERSHNVLVKEQLSFMTEAEQRHLIDRIEQAQSEVGAAKSLFQATDGNAGIDMKVLMPWHRLVTECWQVAQKRRQDQAS